MVLPISRRRFLTGSEAVCTTATISSLPAQATTTTEDVLQSTASTINNLEAIIEETITAIREEYDVGGIAIAAVRNGTETLLNGYGNSFLDATTPVDPTETLFQIGSTSKLIT